MAKGSLIMLTAIFLTTKPRKQESKGLSLSGF